MPTLTLRDLPEDLHTWLKREASTHDRSVDQEVIALLEVIRTHSTEPQPKVTAEELLAIGRRCAALPVLDHRSEEEILGYDEHGIPR